MENRNVLIYITVSNNQKTYVNMIRLDNGHLYMRFTKEKAQADSFRPQHVNHIKHDLEQKIGHVYTEIDDRVMVTV